MPFNSADAIDSNVSKNEAAVSGLDLLKVHSDSTDTMQKQDAGMPTARLVGLAGVTAGLTELTMNQLGTNSAKLFQESAAELAKSAYTGSAGLYNAIDRLRVREASSLLSDIRTVSGPLSAASSVEVGKMVNYGIDVTESLREKAFQAGPLMDSSVKVAGEVAKVKGQFDQLSAGFFNRSEIKDIMHNDRIVIGYGGAKLQAPMTAAELRTFGETGFNKGSLFGEGMVKKAASMAPGEKNAPSTVVAELAPAWQEKLTKLIADDTKQARLGAQLEAIANPSAAELRGGLLNKRYMDQPLFAEGESITGAIDELAQNRRYMDSVESKLALNQELLHQQANKVNAQMTAELAASSNTQSFVRGFARGALVMTAAVGAGYAIDKMTGREHLAISSPLGAGIDAAAGLTLLTPLPTHFRVPIALATLAAPRVLDAAGYGDFLRPAALHGDSVWRPNAVDAIGLGLAAGLNVDNRVRLGIGAATIVAGRAYNIMNGSTPTQYRELDMSKSLKMKF